MSSPQPPDEVNTDRDLDGPLREHHARLEQEGLPDPAFGDELFAALSAPRRTNNNALLGALGLAAALAGVAVLGFTLAFLRPDPSPSIDPAASGTPPPTAVAVATPTETVSPTATASPSPSAPPAATAEPSTTATAPPSPTAAPTVAPTAEPTAAPTPEPTLTMRPVPTRSPSPLPESTLAPLAGTWEFVSPLPHVEYFADWSNSNHSASLADAQAGPDGLLYALLWNSGEDRFFFAYDPVTDAWTDRTGTGSPSGTEAFLVPGERYIHRFESFDGTAFWVYDVEAGQWQPELGRWRAEFSDAVVGTDGRAYFIERRSSRAAAVDLATGVVELVADPGGGYRHVELARDGRIYAIGNSGLASYDQQSDTWRTESAIVPPRQLLRRQFAAGPDGRLYLDMSDPLSESTEAPILAWDPALRVWLTVPDHGLPEIPILVGGPDDRLYAIYASATKGEPRAVAAFTPAESATD